MKLTIFPKRYAITKEMSKPELGRIFRVTDGLVFGERCAVIDQSKKTIFRTKGTKKQVIDSLPKILFNKEIAHKRALCFPGHNHFNWYHFIADIGFQLYQAKKYNLADVIILPSKFRDLGIAFHEFIKGFSIPIVYVQTARSAIKASEVIYFDRSSSRLSEAINDKALERDVVSYYQFLADTFAIEYQTMKAASSKIFSTRNSGDTRCFDGMNEIEKKYAEQGYDIVYFGDKTLYEQASIMKGVENFAGFHGANMTNIVFAQKCKTLHELITLDLSDDFKTIATSKNIKYSSEKIS